MSTVMNLRKRVEALEQRVGDLEAVDAVTDEADVPTDEPDERTADQLVDDHSRDELNDLARSAGVDAPEDLDNKGQVAAAIVAARDGGA